jgi:macrolide transport system ATP-binding/permease protein
MTAAPDTRADPPIGAAENDVPVMVKRASRPLLELHGVCKHYKTADTTVRALDDVSLTVNAGEFVAIIGQSGSGKSTLMNILGCLDKPTAGTYRIGGQDVATVSPDALAALRRDTFGFVFQRYNLLTTATAAENVELPGIYAGMSTDPRQDRAEALLAQLGLADRMDHRPSELSGGQQQRVSIARALMNDPAVILADEPTGALDSRSGTEVLALLRALHAEGRTILLITHDPQIAANADRTIRLRDGRVVADSGPVAAPAASTAKSAIGTRHHASWLSGFGEAVKMALRALSANLFRTILTLLGVIIGVAAVVAMLAIGSGSQNQVMERISAIGTNLLLVRPGAAGIRSSGDNASLTPEDARALQQIANVEAVSPERSTGATVRYGGVDYRTQIVGTWPGYIVTRDWTLTEGSFFNERDVVGYAPVIVLGATVASTLFPDQASVVGRYVLVRNVPFEVIGVLGRKGASPFGQDQDDVAVVPLTTGFMRLFGRQFVNGITVRVADVAQIDATQAALTQELLARHLVENFQIRNTAAILETAAATQQVFTLLLGSLAAISLLVGGIGVMNIMLVNVTERTREIGLRMATGARMRDILVQFNTEAVVVCGLGGVIGVACGLGVAGLLRLFGAAVVFSFTPPLVAFSCAFAIGVLFGYLPARKAARMDPVTALASE